MSEHDGMVRKKRRHRHSEPAQIVAEHENGANGGGNLHRSGRVSRRLLLSIWILIAVNFCFFIVGLVYLLGHEDKTVVDRALSHSLRQTLYQRAIEDAAYSAEDGVSHFLQPVDFTNPLIKWRKVNEEQWLKVVSWASDAEYQDKYQSLKVGDEATDSADQLQRLRVTLAPQVQQFCSRLTNNEQLDVNFRLKQYLGLNPNHRYERFVELWVRAEDLFRPCVDPEINDRFCNLEVSKRGPAKVKNIDDYSVFLRQLKVESYRPDGRPWTRLGYTYDWIYGQRGVGASEYMLVPEARFQLAGSYSTDEYCGLDK
ncbi:MAG: hypothetical protein V7739_00915 [Motiliproteus sp.]